MFRAVLRPATVRLSARTAVASRSAVAIQRFARFESTKAPQTTNTETSQKETNSKKELLEARDELQRDWDAKELSYEELKPKTLQPTPETYLIDVREPDEVLQGSIPSAVNVPLSVLANALHMNPLAFKEAFGFDKPKTDQEITFYCRSGKRSTTACDVAKRNGYKNLLNYKGSWLEWVEREGKKAN